MAVGKQETEYDVLVVGTGASGMSAAMTAAHEGLKVLVVDKAPVYGGTTERSGGWCTRRKRWREIPSSWIGTCAIGSGWRSDRYFLTASQGGRRISSDPRSSTFLIGVFDTSEGSMASHRRIVVASLAAGCGFYMLHNTLQACAANRSATARGTAVSLFACALFIGQSAGVSAAAWVAERHMVNLWYALAGPALLVLASVFARRLHSHLAPSGQAS
jgi:hypothetical protein